MVRNVRKCGRRLKWCVLDSNLKQRDPPEVGSVLRLIHCD